MLSSVQQMKQVDPSANGPRAWGAVTAAALSTFAVVTTEMLPVGLLSPIAEEMDTTLGTAGFLITLPAILAAFFAPIVVIAASNIDRRLILCTLLALLVMANALSALAPTIYWLFAARVVVGICMGGIWGIAGGLASRLVLPKSVGLATALIFGGVAAASVLGVPMGVMIGDHVDWRAAFWAMTIFSGMVLLANIGFLPQLPVSSVVSPHRLCEQFSNRLVRIGLLLTLLMVAGHFMAYTFVRPLLQTLSGIEPEWIGILLLGYGVVGLIGNFAAGIVSTLRPKSTVLAIAAGLAASTLLFQWLGASPASGTIMLLIWGLFYGGVSVSLQTWMMQSAPTAIEAVTALFVAVFNIGIALGSFLGGRMIDFVDLDSMLIVAGCLPIAAAVTILYVRNLNRAGIAGGSNS